MAACLRALGWFVTEPTPTLADLPVIELGQLWIPASPYGSARRITFVGEGGYPARCGELFLRVQVDNRPEMDMPERDFLEWVRVTGARPRDMRGAVASAVAP